MSPGLKKRIEEVRKSQSKLDERSLSIGMWLDKLIDDMDSVSRRLKELKSQRVISQPGPVDEKAHVPEADFKRLLEELLQGSMKHLEDRLSQKILNMLKGLRTVAGPEREAKIREIKEAVNAELIDLSRLFIHEEVESNREEIGVEEKESKGIDKSLKRLRRMRENKAGKEDKEGKGGKNGNSGQG